MRGGDIYEDLKKVGIAKDFPPPGWDKIPTFSESRKWISPLLGETHISRSSIPQFVCTSIMMDGQLCHIHPAMIVVYC